MEYDPQNKFMTNYLKEMGGTKPEPTHVTWDRRSNPMEAIRHIGNHMIERLVKEACELEPHQKLSIDDFTNVFTENARRHRDFLKGMISIGNMPALMRSPTARDLYPQPSASNLKFTFRAWDIDISHMVEPGYILMLRKGWFEFANENSTQAYMSPSNLPLGMNYYDVHATIMVEHCLANAAMTTLIPDKVTVLKLVDSEI